MIRLKKVRVHNLKEVNLEIEKGKLIVFTGVSGSGKTSLAFDTIYVEGQRCYIQSLSHQARRLVSDLPKPDAESITGLAPTIAIEQKTSGKTPRSTVGTMTGIYDFLRVLYAKLAEPYCPESGERLLSQSREKIIAQIQNLEKGKKAILLAPFAKGKKGEFKEEFQELLSKGFLRVRIDGTWADLSEEIVLDPKKAHDIDLVIDRFVITQENRSRIAESVTLALEMGEGFCLIDDTLYSEYAYSEKSGLSFGKLEAHDFSFNHPQGMCPECQGLGKVIQFDLNQVIDPEKSIEEDCCSIASSYSTVRYGNIYRNLARQFDFKVSTPWKKLSSSAKEVFLNGTKTKWTRMNFVHPVKKTRWIEYVRWQGVLHEAKERLQAAKSDAYQKKMQEKMKEQICPSCKGARIRAYPAAARFHNKTIHEISSLTLEEMSLFFEKLKLNPIETQVGDELVKEIRQRLKFLTDVGLSYLCLERTSPTLSGGESQRVRLASQLGVGLVGAIYVLDEPSIGLHPIDHHKLISTLLRLRDQGNTVLVVEHDPETILAADQVIDVGPGAGSHGGEILSLNDPRSLTGAYLSGKKKIEPPKKRRKKTGILELKNITHHNLKNVSVDIPLGIFTCVTGVSGSGKSSLILDQLVPLLEKRELKGIEQIDKVISVDQSPIGRTPRSNPATYIKLFDEIRDLFKELPESRLRGFTASHFSFNVKEGSCSYCSGLGEVKLDMDFMEDASIECKQCKGKRFDPEILAVQFKGKSIYDVLETDVENAIALFEGFPSIEKKLKLLSLVGLNYLKLGQASTTLSGGEAQRIKLAKELVRPASGQTIYILDEPTTGLHFEDIAKLLSVLQKLVDRGNTVLVIEHNMDFVKCADWIIDLGPGPGVYGGKIIAEGTPEKISKEKSATGKALQGFEVEKRPVQPELEKQEIIVEGASQNNLKNISIKIPKGKISVFTGPSGSGKTSMAFDTLYAEGQRRYIETLPSYLRSQLNSLPKPKVDRMEGLLASIALEQKTGGLNPRSTVGTMTEIYDLLRVLYAHLGVPYDPKTKKEIRKLSKQEIVDQILSFPEKEKILLLTPISFERNENFEKLVERLQRQGYLRIRLNGQTYSLDEKIPYEPLRKNELLLVIDRLLVQKKSEKRLFEAIEQAKETLIVAKENEDLEFELSQESRSSPQLFSFNHEMGMCPECQGLGVSYGAHLSENSRLLKKSVFQIAERLFKEKTSQAIYPILKKTIGGDLQILLHGGEETKIKKGLSLRWLGLETALANAARMGVKAIKEALLPIMKADICPSCSGARLNEKARHVLLKDLSITDLCKKSLKETLSFIQKQKVPIFLEETKQELISHLEFLISIGLDYLSLDRSAPTLSGGELQRIRLAKQLGSNLSSCLYILDEPTIGLHPYNNEQLNQALQKLKDLGNTLVLVEHDPMTIQIADQLFDFGPKAGREGGKITASGSIKEIKKDPNSLTGAYLSGKKKIEVPKKRRELNLSIEIRGASLHNLKNLTVSLPRSAITCLTGVSGSGKSSLLTYLEKRKEFEKIITIDQSPIGQTNRADVSTYTEIQPLIRSLFSSLPAAAIKGLLPRAFSPNHLKGMCRTCWGLGYRTVHLQFLPPVRIVCESCKGFRLNPLSLEIKYKGKHFGQILQMRVEEALSWFSSIPKIVKKLQTLIAVGLDYLQLGQEVVSLSGGEAQRLRLSRELSKRESGKTLYLIDEPTVGLHPEDVQKLLAIFHQLADKKNTIVIIEHNLDVIVNADYIIDLGPDSGEKGGEIVAKGTPEEVAKIKASKTGKYIQERLSIRK